MDKEKLSRKRSSDPRDSLPSPPPNPQKSQPLPEAFKRLLDYKDRERSFLKELDEAIAMDCKRIRSESERSMTGSLTGGASSVGGGSGLTIGGSDFSEASESLKTSDESRIKSDCELLRDECESFVIPLLNRTGPSISAALMANDAFEQLNRLHGLIDQMLTFQEQNYQMRRYLRDVRTLCELKKLQKKDPNELLEEDEISDTELDLEGHVSLLSTILAAGTSATTKRNSAKRQRERSKSVIADDMHMYTEKENKLVQPRRQSAFSETKSKVSKWTKVKAAFKWERANVPVMNEGKSSDSGIGLTPVNNEVARYLRVPSVPCTGSSVDSVLSSSSGHLLSGGSIPATPGTISSASSLEEVAGVGSGSGNVGPGGHPDDRRRESSKSDTRCDSRSNEDETRRSRSLDGDAVVNQQLVQSKNKTPWRKVKEIIQTHRGSFKNKTRSRSLKSSGTGSRDASPCESLDAISNSEDRTEVYSSNQTSPVQKNLPALSLNTSCQDIVSGPTSPGSTGAGSRGDESDGKLVKVSTKTSRKSRILSDFESLPEDVIVDLKTNYNLGKPPPSPLNLSGRQVYDSSDADMGDSSYSPTLFSKGSTKINKSKKGILSGNSSVPSSPSRHSEFFGEFESEDLSSGDFSEPSTPHRKLSPKSSLQYQQDEINERYMELKERINHEFEAKRMEWEKIRSACASSASNAFQLLIKDEFFQPRKSVSSKLLEENLSPDFKKKLHKWRVKKQTSVTNIKDPQTSPTKETEQKKIDWNLWKMGQIKLEGQGLSPLPDQKDLPEDFQKKLEEWKKMKDTNSVPTYNSQDSLRRQSGKFGQGTKFDVLKKPKEEIEKLDRDRQRLDREKLKSHEREKLSKLKAMVAAELPAQEIEVKTAEGVLKFEGISRKFTRKLYEWEKARGIGPESSTFALLHPGYRPIDVGNGATDKKSQENSPTLGRSLSLDSVSPNHSMPSISHQPSSLSLNDMDERKEGGNAPNDKRISSNPEMDNKDNYDEPEAVIVEVEDDIVETAAPLLTAIPILEQQTPVYKYEIACNAFCSGNSETVLRGKPHKSDRVSSQALDDVRNLAPCLQDANVDYKKNVRHVQQVLWSLKESLPELEKSVRGCSSPVRDAFEVVKKLLREVMVMMDSLKQDEPCLKEVLDDRTRAIDSKLASLQKSVNLVCKYADITPSTPSDSVPEISITSDDASITRSVAIVSTIPTVFQTEVIINQPQVQIDEISVQDTTVFDGLRLEQTSDGSPKKITRNVSNGSKKKMRLRKMGSRQNSKTESDSDEEQPSIVLEAPRRIKRKTSRAKRQPEEEKKVEPKKEETFTAGDDIVYVLKIKPGQKIEQKEVCRVPSDTNVLISPMESCVELLEAPQDNTSNSANVFVKTKRKIFTTVDEPLTGESKAVIARELESSSPSASERNEMDKDKSDIMKSPSAPVVRSLPPIPQSPITQRRLDQKITSPKEPSASIRLMIAKYNQKLATGKGTRSPISSGSCSPVGFRSPILDRRVVRVETEKYEQKVERVVKSASAGNIGATNCSLVPIEISEEDYAVEDNTITKSCSVDTLPNDWWVNPSPVDQQSANGTDVECPIPLACDSLKEISKNLDKSGDEETTILSDSLDGSQKKEHLFKKNKEKPTSLFSKTGAIKKIGLRKAENLCRRSISSSAGESWSIFPDKADNTVPKITRKYDAKPFASENVYRRGNEDHFWHPSASAPTTPSEDPSRPKTPLSERALKLQKAKEDFLRGGILRNSFNWEGVTKDELWRNRLSQVSMGSESSHEDCVLAKSASVGVIGIASPDSRHVSGYESLPRDVARSSKIISKLGFSSIASKFRMVKMRRGSKDLAKMNTVSTLCRQSLSIDVMPEEIAGQLSNRSSISGTTASSSTGTEGQSKILSKSGSLQGISLGTLFRRTEKEKINKSKSTNVVVVQQQQSK